MHHCLKAVLGFETHLDDDVAGLDPRKEIERWQIHKTTLHQLNLTTIHLLRFPWFHCPNFFASRVFRAAQLLGRIQIPSSTLTVPSNTLTLCCKRFGRMNELCVTFYK